jgi:hypothetical protein
MEVLHGQFVTDIKPDIQILVIPVKFHNYKYQRLILAQTLDQTFDCQKAQIAKVISVELFGGTYIVKTTLGNISLTNSDSGSITFIKQ